jgi:hypothetical protein
MNHVLPEWLISYVENQDAQRADAVNDVLASLTDRERALVKDAAVMGYVQGMRHPHAEQIPGDATIAVKVVEACLALPDLYRAISGYVPETEEEDGS